MNELARSSRRPPRNWATSTAATGRGATDSGRSASTAAGRATAARTEAGAEAGFDAGTDTGFEVAATGFDTGAEAGALGERAAAPDAPRVSARASEAGRRPTLAASALTSMARAAAAACGRSEERRVGR